MAGGAVKEFQTRPGPPEPNELSFEMLEELESGSAQVLPVLTLALPDVLVTEVLLPDGVVDLGDGNPSFVGCASWWQCVDDPPDTPDDAGSYAWHQGSVTERYGLTFADLQVSLVTRINEVRLFWRGMVSSINNAPIQVALEVNGTEYFGDFHDGTERFTPLDWQTTRQVYELNPDTGEAWTLAEVNALRAVYIHEPFGTATGGTGSTRLTQAYIEVDYATEVIGKWSSAGVNSETEGLFQGRVLRWSNVVRSAVGRSNALERTSAKVTISDTDFLFASILDGDRSHEVRKASAVIQLVSPNVQPENWKTLFTGILQAWNEVRPQEWELELRPNDEPTDGKIPKDKINEQDVPDAEEKSYDLFVPLIWGKHDSTDIGDNGMIRCPYVDTVQFTYLVCFGRAKAVNRVFTQEGTENVVEVTSGFSIIFPIVNGRQYTAIQFTADQETKNVRADVEGYETVGDGTGTLIDNPAEMLKHFLVNFVFGNYQGGDWLDETTAPLDFDSFTETAEFLNTLGVSGSRYIGGTGNAIKARDEINRWARQFELKVFWTGDGELAVKPNDHRDIEVYQDNNWIREGLHDLQEVSYKFDTGGLIDRILISYQHNQADKAFLANIEIRDFNIDEDKKESLQAFWFPSSKPGA